MGNKVCCQETRTEGVLEKQNVQLSKYPSLSDSKLNEKAEAPELIPKVRQTLLLKKFFHQEQSRQSNAQVKRYGQDIYVGSLDSKGQKPNGFGRMYKNDRSLYIGHFELGKAKGKGVFIFPDGSYYQGDFFNNTAQTNYGEYCSDTLKYKGGFRNNVFDNHGSQFGKGYVYQGYYSNGSRTKGTLKWENETRIYEGTFNQENKLHGKGKLTQPEGTYQGDFWAGEKQGKGRYRFKKNESLYDGEYLNGLRHGHGKIYNKTGGLLYDGQFRFGLPDGKGQGIDNKTGKMTQSIWVQGIDSVLLPQTR